jgi:hypothetical protein
MTADARLRLTVRRANLAARLERPPTLSPARLAKLAAEVQRLAHLAAFDAWRAALDGALAASLPEATGMTADAAPWLLEPRHRAIVRGIALLDGAERRLARRLLAARAGAPPWDLRDAPANRAFLERVRARGIDVAPWLDGLGAFTHGELALAIERDPLEVLHMGRHFRTCLSPAAENFYSAVVNAVDANKRVVYGRAADGAVVGRCLLALTDEGAIVTFAPYSHDRARAFEPAVRAFVEALAAAMGTSTVPGGTVRPLLHHRWYDDGARDLTRRFPFLDAGSAFRASLAELDPDELIPTITRAFAPLALGGYALGLILRLDELDARPALAIPLAPLIARVDDLPVAMQLRAAALLDAAGRPELIDPRLPDHLARTLRHAWRHDHWIPAGQLPQLAELAPARALALLRELRPRRRSDRDDPRYESALAAAIALERLGRPRQALVQLRRALADAHGADVERCRARIAALEAALARRR